MDFLQQYGFLIATMLQQGLLGLSLYAPLMAGQLSLASPGFYALGGYIAAIMLTNPAFAGWRDTLGYGIYPLTWLLAGAACGLLAGVIVGVPALRLRGIYLALATIAFVEILRVLALNLSVTGGAIGPFRHSAGLRLRGPLAVPVAVFAAADPDAAVFPPALAARAPGRAFRAIREDELAADAMGVSPTRYKVLAFVIGAVLAGIVGSMSAPFLNTWNAKQGTFDASIAYLAYVLIGGSRSMWGPLVGGALLSALPELLRSPGRLAAGHQRPGAGGGELVLAAGHRGQPQPQAPTAQPPSATGHQRRSVRAALHLGDRVSAPSPTCTAAEAPVLLDAQQLTRRFGGLVAVNGVSFQVRRGEIFGLIGPNGAGKTTLFNLMTGLTPPCSGSLKLRRPER